MPPPFLTISDLLVTLTFDLLTRKSNQFVSIPKPIKIVNRSRSEKNLLSVVRVWDHWILSVKVYNSLVLWLENSTEREAVIPINVTSIIQTAYKYTLGGWDDYGRDFMNELSYAMRSSTKPYHSSSIVCCLFYEIIQPLTWRTIGTI